MGDSEIDSDADPLLIEALGMQPVARAALVAGDVLDGTYRIERKLGAGGMGVVYLARDLRLQRDVAIKLHGERAGDGEGARLLREATAMAQLVHPNVATVYQVGTWSGRPYIAMEYVAGGTLREWLAAPHAPRQIVEKFVDAGRGLAAAHAIGIVHRDFKPDNVLVGRDGRARVSDFGLARATDASDLTSPAPSPSPAPLSPLTQAGSVVGTPAYMAPEQRTGVAGTAADQFAFAVALWEALAGHRPEPVSGKALARPAGRMSARVHAALTRALAVDPEERFSTMDALLAALTDDRRRRWAIGVAAVVALAAIAIVVAVGARRDPAVPPWRPRVVELGPAFDEHTTYPSISPDGTEVAFASNRERVSHYRAYIAPLLGGPARVVTPPEMNAAAVRWRRDGRSVLVTARHGEDLTVYDVPLAGGSPTVLGTTFAATVDDCGDGRVLLVPRDLPDCPTCTALVLRTPDGTRREVHRSAPGDVIIRAACDRDGRRIVFSMSKLLTTEPPADLWLLTIDGGAPRRLTSDAAYNLTPTFHPDGKSIIYSALSAGTRNLWEMPLDGGIPRQLTTGEGPDIGPAITPDGRVLVFNIDITSYPLVANVPGAAPRRITGRIDLDQPVAVPGGDEVIAEINVASGKRIAAIRVADGSIRDVVEGARPSVTHDGSEVVFRSAADATRVQAIPRTGGAAREVGVAPGTVEVIHVDADGIVHLAVRTAATIEAWRLPLGGGSAAVRDAPAPWAFVKPAPAGGWRAFFRPVGPTAREARLVPPGASPSDPRGHTLRGLRFDWYPAGDAMVYFDPPWVRRFDVRTGQETQLFEAGDFVVLSAAPDGRTIYTVDRNSHVRRMAMTNFDERPR
jgi:dipeptidyl aminopeptidase/acylaminoacyl peptidase/predicted Ser/Thr protein kinase